MTRRSPASDAATALLGALVREGVRDVVVAPGSRSQALALAAAELHRAVGGAHDEGHAGVVRLEHGGVQVRDGGARRGHDHRRTAGLDGRAERQEARAPLVDAHVQADRADAFELRRGEGERLGTRAGRPNG